MKRSTSVLVVLLVLVVTGAATYRRGRISARRDGAQSARGAVTFYPTEDLWIVKDISGAIANMASYATHRTNAIAVRQVPKVGNELARFEIAPVAHTPVAIAITDHIWAPGAYVPLVTALMGTAPTACAANGDIAAALLKPTYAVIQRENARVSARLRADMRCADAHLEAALLQGTLALREAASPFNDPRRLISRMTAHLAMAEASGAVADSPLRRLADAMAYTLAGRQRSALERMAVIDTDGAADVAHAWARALRLRNTADWRIVADPDHATLVEQIELLRAVNASLGDPRTLDIMDAIHNPADVPDWARIIMEGRPGVDAGNRFADSAVVLELREATEVRKDYAPARTLDDPEALVEELKVEPTAGPVAADGTVWVIDWPTWAAISERHLITAINNRDTHITNVLCLVDQGRAFREQVAKTFAGLRLYPFLAITLAPTKEEARPGMAASLKLIQTHPELVSHWMWKSVLAKETWAGLPVRIPPLDSWFAPAFPLGTVFDPTSRPWRAGPALQFTPALVAPYRAAAPYARSLSLVSLGKDFEKASAAALTKEFGDIAAYNLDAAKRIANAQKDDPAAYMAAMAKVTALSPEHLADVAEYSVMHGDAEAARSAYERWFATGRDEVAIANSAGWMVRDYFLRHENAKAIALAERAARVYSYGGLMVRARLFDWMGDTGSAERYYRTAAERYDYPADLAGFYLRHPRKGVDVDQVMWKVFPAGVSRIVLPSLREAPRDGISVETAGFLGEQNGVRSGDIIVGIDGIRVQNMWQYAAAKTASLEPVVRYTVWRDLRYIEVPASVRFTWFGSSVQNYQPGSGRKTR